MEIFLIVLIVLISIAGFVWFKKAKAEDEKRAQARKPTKQQLETLAKEQAEQEALLVQLERELAENPTGILLKKIADLKAKLGIE